MLFHFSLLFSKYTKINRRTWNIISDLGQLSIFHPAEYIFHLYWDSTAAETLQILSYALQHLWFLDVTVLLHVTPATTRDLRY
jgi:hypothetical protein